MMIEQSQFQQDQTVQIQRSANVFQNAVFDRVAASATLSRNRQPSRLPEKLQNRHRALSILQTVLGVILFLLGFVGITWSNPASFLGNAIGVWSGPAYFIAGQLGCQAGRNGNASRSRRITLRWSLVSFLSCVTSFTVGLAAIVLRAKRIDLPPAPVAVTDCVNLTLICLGVCFSAGQAAFAGQCAWLCSFGYVPKPPMVAPPAPGLPAIYMIDGVQQHQQVRQQGRPNRPVCNSTFQDLSKCEVCGCSTSVGALKERSWVGSTQTALRPPLPPVPVLPESILTPPPAYQEWHTMAEGPERLDSSNSSSPAEVRECQSMMTCAERRGKNLRVHWKL